MKKLTFAMLASCFAMPAGAQSAPMSVSVQATGGWEMICHVTTRSGDQEAVVLDPGRSSLSSGDFNSVSCEETSSGRGPMVISVKGPAVCPFKAAAAGACQQSFPHGPGSFVVRPKRP